MTCPTDARSLLASLRELAPQAEQILIGQAPIRAWFKSHGFRGRSRGSSPTWQTLKDWRKRSSFDFSWYTTRYGRQPVTSTFVLLVWAVFFADSVRRGSAVPSRRTKYQRARG